MKSYLFISDAGHGWLRVPKEDVQEIKHLISPYSYESKRYIFLEEDLDLSIFFAFMKKKEIDFVRTCKNYSNYAPVRNYPHYSAGESWQRDAAYGYIGGRA